jgi:putative transposase
MPRKARLMIPGLPVHVIQRGNNRSDCFHSECDYAMYLRLLAAARAKEGCHLHAYVLMTNHVHLLVTSQTRDGISRMMKQLGESYVPYFNARHGRSGTLWEGRFRSSIVESDRYLLTCHRYIEANPVRAAMVMHPGDYRWSSHRANAMGERDDLLTPHALYLSLGHSQADRLAAYRALFGRQIDPVELARIRDAVNGCFALGTSQFIERVEKATGRRVERMTKGRLRVSSVAMSDGDNRGLSPVV